MENIIDFPAAADRPKRRNSRRRRPYSPMRKFVFRSYDKIVASDEAELVRDVCFDIDRAESKLGRITQRLKNVEEEATAKVQLLTTAKIKLSAAIVVALLSRGQA
ncbi:hypothetical protein SAMN05443247_08865 [Bradyrhizobium erythrophlei]|jgi:hypothetical protein|nr:hypothetical protein SAMN05443247_08865 [Bradyrhizobium erythrophlei]